MPFDELNAIIGPDSEPWSLLLIDHTGTVCAEHQAQRIVPSASLIKLALVWCWLEQSGAEHAQSQVIQPADICDADGSLAQMIGQTVPLWELARRTITESENNATNLLLDAVGGMPVVNDWLAAHGLTDTHWRRRMVDWQARAAGYDNTTTAHDIAQLLYALQTAHERGAPAATTLVTWLSQSFNDGKLEAGLPAGTPLAHKTGDLPDGIAEHDAGIVGLPDGGWYVLALLGHDVGDVAAARATVAAVSRWCWTMMTTTHDAAAAHGW